MRAGSCDVWKAATAVSSLDRSWAEELCRVAPLPTHLCRDLVVITTHPYEAMSAAGGLISHLAAQAADVEVLAVTDGDGAAPLQHHFGVGISWPPTAGSGCPRYAVIGFTWSPARSATLSLT